MQHHSTGVFQESRLETALTATLLEQRQLGADSQSGELSTMHSSTWTAVEQAEDTPAAVLAIHMLDRINNLSLTVAAQG